MRLNFEYQGENIAYNLSYKKRGTISIQVESDGTVNVVAPVGTTIFSVMDKVKGHAHWIREEIARTQKANTHLEQYMYLGKNYGVEIVEVPEQEEATVKLLRGKFLVETNDVSPQAVKEEMKKWYAVKTLAKAKERVKALSEHFEAVPKKVDIAIIPKRLYEVNEEVFALDINCGFCPTHVIDCVLTEALCKYNGMTEVQGKLAEVVPEYLDAKEWIMSNKDRFIFG